MMRKVISFSYVFLLLSFFLITSLRGQELDEDELEYEEDELLIQEGTKGRPALASQKPDSIRGFDADKIKEYRDDPAFNYERIVDPNKMSLIEWLQHKFWEWIDSLFNNSISLGNRRIVMITLAAIIITYALYMVLSSNKIGIFSRNPVRTNIKSDEFNLDIHQIDFDKIIQEAIDAGMYTVAVRFLYLKTLKKMSDDNLIQWQIGKTNEEYIREIDKKPFKAKFIFLTQLFEYICYGDFKVGEQQFLEAKQEFQLFAKELQST